MDLMELFVFVLIGAVRLIRYICLHVMVPHNMDLIVFGPLIKWVEERILGTGTEAVGSEDVGPGDDGV